jgi:mannose-6-phosphate isomerase-like protein (cupin superfamily)
MTGWRVGWMIGPKDVIKAATNLQSHLTSNVSNVSQRAAIAALTGDLSAVHKMGEAFDRRRKLIVGLLNEVPGFELKLVEGFTENEPHYHRTFGEAYIVASGTIITRLTCIATRQFHTQELRMGDCVVIPPNTVHHVIGGSEDNRIIVAYWPRFRGTKGEDWNPAS